MEWDFIEYLSAAHDDKPLSSLISESHPLQGNADAFIRGCESMGVDG